MFFGVLDPAAPDAAASRAAACGHVTSHGSSFIANPAYQFTYEIRKATDAAAGAPSFEVRLWNASTDRTFALSYRDDITASGYRSEGTITLADPAGGSGALRLSAFTTF